MPTKAELYPWDISNTERVSILRRRIFLELMDLGTYTPNLRYPVEETEVTLLGWPLELSLWAIVGMNLDHRLNPIGVAMLLSHHFKEMERQVNASLRHSDSGKSYRYFRDDFFSQTKVSEWEPDDA